MYDNLNIMFLFSFNNKLDSTLSRDAKLIVDASQEFLLEALLNLINKNHEPGECVFTKLISVMTHISYVAHTEELEKSMYTEDLKTSLFLTYGMNS